MPRASATIFSSYMSYLCLIEAKCYWRADYPLLGVLVIFTGDTLLELVKNFDKDCLCIQI